MPRGHRRGPAGGQHHEAGITQADQGGDDEGDANIPAAGEKGRGPECGQDGGRDGVQSLFQPWRLGALAGDEHIAADTSDVSSGRCGQE